MSPMKFFPTPMPLHWVVFFPVPRAPDIVPIMAIMLLCCKEYFTFLASKTVYALQAEIRSFKQLPAGI